MSRNYFISLFISVFFLFYFTSCEQSRFDISTDQIEINFKSNRFDRDLFRGDFSNLSELKQSLYQKYGEFYSAFVERIIKVGPADSLTTLNNAKGFIDDPVIKEVQADIDEIYTDKKIEELSKEFEIAFKRFHYYFPQIECPELIFYNSGFNNGIVVLEGQMAIGLDFYLGSDNEFVSQLPGEQFQLFKREKMNPEYLVADAIKYWMEIELIEYADKKDLLGEVIYKGKIMYMMDALFPDLPDHIKMRYFQEEIEWAEKNEKAIWMEMAQQEIIYGTKPFDNKKWLVDAPFTNAGALPPESPPRLGEWIGWRIIKDYMDDNPETSVSELLSTGPNQKFLKSYDPRN